MAICPEKAKSMRTLISQPVAKLEKILVNDALAVLLDQNLTKQQYISIRDQTKNNLVSKIMKDQGSNFLIAELQYSDGFDGSWGHSNYKQGLAGPQKCDVDGSIFATTVTPLLMIDSSGNIKRYFTVMKSFKLL